MSDPIPQLPGFSLVSSSIARTILEKRAAANAGKKFEAPPNSYEHSLENYARTAFLAKLFLLLYPEEREDLERDVLKTAEEVRDAANRENKTMDEVDVDLKTCESSVTPKEFAQIAFALVKGPFLPEVYDLAKSFGITRDVLNIEILKVKIEKEKFVSSELAILLKELIAGKEVDLTYGMAEGLIFRDELNKTLYNVPLIIDGWFISAGAMINDDMQLLLSDSAMRQLEKEGKHSTIKIKIHTEDISATS